MSIPNYVIFFTVIIYIYFFIHFPCLSNAETSKRLIERKSGSALNEDDEFDNEDDLEDETLIEYEFHGFVEVENFIHTYKNQELEDSNKKNEIRSSVKFDLEAENLQLKMNMNIYINSNIVDECVNDEYIYTEEFDISRNLRLSDKSYEVSFYELFVGYRAERFRFRVGNQIYGWGTADAMNPTSYFNPMDGRELLFKDEDEMKLAVPSISGLLFFSNYSFEMVFVPMHVPMLMAPEGNFWGVDYSYGFTPLTLTEPEVLEIEACNFAYGVRLSGSIMGTDLSLSGYHGPDIEPIIRPIKTLAIPNESISLLISPKYYTTNYIGIDFSKSISRFVFQCEAAYSPNRTGIIDQGDPEDIDNLEELTLPFEVKRSHYVSYSTGFNYFIPLNKILKNHEGETIFTIEWHQAKFFDHDLMDALMTDIITFRLDDSYFNSRLKLSLTGIYDTMYHGLVLMPRIGLDFLNGLTLDVSYGYIKSFSENEEDEDEEEMLSFLGFFKDNDIIIVEARYEF